MKISTHSRFSLCAGARSGYTIKFMSCPFYGHVVRIVGGQIPAMLPTGGNQCGLITHAHTPCRMEMEGNAPEWDACPRNPAINGTWEHGSLEANRRRAMMGLPPIAGAKGEVQ